MSDLACGPAPPRPGHRSTGQIIQWRRRTRTMVSRADREGYSIVGFQIAVGCTRCRRHHCPDSESFSAERGARRSRAGLSHGLERLVGLTAADRPPASVRDTSTAIVPGCTDSHLAAPSGGAPEVHPAEVLRAHRSVPQRMPLGYDRADTTASTSAA